MSEAKKRALELVNRLEVLVPRHPNEPEEAPIFADLRAAIQAIGASEWRGMDGCEFATKQVIQALIEDPLKRRQVTTLGRLSDGGWWHDYLGRLPADWKVLAWKPADSTELPAEETTK